MDLQKNQQSNIAVTNLGSTLLLKWLLGGYIILTLFPGYGHGFGLGVDRAFVYAMNFLPASGQFYFGKDVVSTYGPLGFINFPQDIGLNLPIAHTIQISMWIVLLLLGIYIVRNRQLSVYHLLLFAIPFTFSFRDMKLQIWILLCCVFLSLVVKKWYFPFGLSVVLTSLLWFIKFNDAMLGLALIIGTIFVFLVYDLKKAISAIAITVVGLPLVFITAYLIYDPSFVDMINYLRGALAVSSQYSVASSLAGRRIEVALAILEIFLCAFLARIFYSQKNKAYILFVAFLPSLFMAFKSGFVRQDGHVLQFFYFLLAMLGFIFLFAEPALAKKWGLPSIGLFTLILATVIVPSYGPVKPDAVLGAATRIKNLVNLYRSKDLAYFEQTPLIDRIPDEVIKSAQLPPNFSELIGEHSVTIFPMEIMYAPINSLNYYPLPTIQGYIAASSYLDQLDAAFFEDEKKSPEFIILGWESVDGRHPLIDTPATWLAIYKWYDWQDGNDTIAILKRRSQPRFTKVAIIKEELYVTGNQIRVPKQDALLAVKISSLKLSPRGQLINLLFRIPEVKIHFQKGMGPETGYRVVPATLSDAIVLNQIPQTFQDAQLMLQGKHVKGVQRIVFFGPGLKYYEKRIPVSYYSLTK